MDWAGAEEALKDKYGWDVLVDENLDSVNITASKNGQQTITLTFAKRSTMLEWVEELEKTYRELGL